MIDCKSTPKNASFNDWIASASIYIGYCRYMQLGGEWAFCVATAYDEDNELREAVDSLDGGDMEALDAGRFIEGHGCWYATDPDPAVAMQKLMGKMREYQRCIDDELS